MFSSLTNVVCPGGRSRSSTMQWWKGCVSPRDKFAAPIVCRHAAVAVHQGSQATTTPRYWKTRCTKQTPVARPRPAASRACCSKEEPSGIAAPWSQASSKVAASENSSVVMLAHNFLRIPSNSPLYCWKICFHSVSSGATGEGRTQLLDKPFGNCHLGPSAVPMKSVPLKRRPSSELSSRSIGQAPDPSLNIAWLPEMLISLPTSSSQTPCKSSSKDRNATLNFVRTPLRCLRTTAAKLPVHATDATSAPPKPEAKPVRADVE
mmetsp:Transcript_160012/g.513391  ORF Transcript_160012/g.513391 Transcript_160012/m.513391 type:complete len:263 (-) Transcript_160012:291-1079(-)